jgi:hypothetical protein
METKPTLNEWRLANPGKSINEYFAEHGSGQAPQQLPTHHPFAPMPERVVYVERQSNGTTDLFGFLASVAGLVAFFMPWVKASGGLVKKVTSVSVAPSGYPEFLAQLANRNQANWTTTEQIVFFTPWLLLILPCFSLLGSFAKSVTLRAVSGYIYAAIAAYWLYATKSLSEMVSSYGVGVGNFLIGFHAQIEPGYYVGIMASILMLLDAIQATWSKN